jgi:hypothetical protein
VEGKSKEEVKDARAAARLAVTLTRAEARDAWYALIARGKRTLSGEGRGLVGPAADILHPDMNMAMC